MAYKFYNPNPTYKEPKPGKKPKKWNKIDCTTRALCAITGKSWKDVFYAQVKTALENFDMPDSNPVFEKTLDYYSGTRHSYPRGQKRETVKIFAANHPTGKYILNLAGHVVAVIDGDYYDVWDCGNKTAYSYYEFK